MTSAEANKKPYVVAVVLTWNDVDMSVRCIESLEANGYPNKDIVVVDNGSAVPGCALIKEQCPNIEPVQLDKNYGFTGGCNRGIERGFEMGADYVFLLNNDTIVHEDAIERLVEGLEQHPDAGLASAVLLFEGGDKRMRFYRSDLRRDIARHVSPERGEALTDAYRATVYTPFAPACAVMFRKQCVDEVGLFDETFFTNWEDYDICCRIGDAGWKIITVGQAEVIHAHGQTTGKISPFITYFFARNRLICLFRYGKLLGILKNTPFILRTFYWQIRAYGFTNWPAHAAFAKGVCHFLLGIRGDRAPKKTSD